MEAGVQKGGTSLIPSAHEVYAAAAPRVIGSAAPITARIPPQVSTGLVWIGVAAVLACTLLQAIGLPLEVEPGFGMTRFLEGDARVMPTWTSHDIRGLAIAYLVFDTFVFLPLYILLFIGLAQRLMQAPATQGQEFLASIVVLATALAGVCDLVENALGLFAFGLSVPKSVLLLATHGKTYLVTAAIVGLLVLLLWRFFAIGVHDPAVLTSRARLRASVVDIVWRARYVLLALALFGGLVIVMDQSRDVLVGIAQGLQTQQWPGALLVLALSAVALWALSYSSWMSARIICRLQRPAGSIRAMRFAAGSTLPTGTFAFAQWWARALGAIPVLVLVWLCGFAACDAVRARATTSAYLLLTFGVATLIGAVAFLWDRQRRRASSAAFYYNATSDLLGKDGELTQTCYRFLRVVPNAPVMLPVAALIALTLLRGIDVLDVDMPSVSFVVICLGVTLWLGVVAFVSELALLHGRPYVLFWLALVLGFGWFELTGNHVVWTALRADGDSDGLTTMWLYQAILAAIAVGAVVAAFRWRPRGGWLVALYAVTLVLFVVTLLVADRNVPRSLAAVIDNAPQPRPSLNEALEQWLKRLCADGTVCARAESDASAPYAAYFVSTEGGGIRAAYWTALVLAELSGRIPDFDSRTFSISGVSGGAIGATIYRTCRAKQTTGAGLVDCVQKFSKVNLLGPLLSAWMFEDILARVVPTVFCETPGCGILSRGAWFEQSLESTWPDLRDPLTRSRSALGAQHLPYLLLNSTWVETAERAIGSDLVIDHASFPTARDQVRILGRDLPLSTASHNAARFPYVNAIGSVRTKRVNCPMRRDDLPPEEVEKTITCGHLADGGYFDNSGGHSTADVLRALAFLLAQEKLAGLEPARLEWLRKNLVAQVIMIRNGTEKKDENDCNQYAPETPRCKGRFNLLTDLLGPPVTAFNAIGTGANGRVAESLLKKAVRSARPRSPGSTQTADEVVNVDLYKDGILYPLGWYLSLRARCGMQDQARDNLAYVDLCGAQDVECRARAGVSVLPPAGANGC